MADRLPVLGAGLEALTVAGIGIREHGYGSMKNPDYAYDTWRDRRDEAADHAQQQADEERRRAEEDPQSNQQK